jgi:hypothetical protein
MRVARALLPMVLVAGCTAGSSVTTGPTPGSAAWYETASPQQIANYFRAQCVAFGHLPGTPEIAECIKKEADAARQSNVARAAAIAAATAGN